MVNSMTGWSEFRSRRREFLYSAGGLTTGLLWGGSIPDGTAELHAAEQPPEQGWQLATFRFDVTPPLGHSLCGGWIPPASDVADPLEAVGLVLLGAGKPIVLCAVDWTGLLNEAHVAWRTALAEACGTTPDRVAVHCVHQHDAPFACLEAERIVAAQGDLPPIVDPEFFERCLTSGKEAVREGLNRAVPITHVAQGQARVEKVASNRRLVGLDGKVVSQRGSSSRTPFHQQYPEGLIDPFLKTVAFYHHDRKVAACHYYACHPMSHYGRGQVSADFCGLARKQRQREEPQCVHLYFNGCGGNIGAGKYNDGAPETRPILVERMHRGIVESEQNLRPQPIRSLHWSSQEILPPPRTDHDPAEVMRQIADRSRRVVDRNRPAYLVAYHRRFEKQLPIVLSALHVNEISLLHYPSESFIEYQLRAQVSAPDRFVACAGYGDGGPWYIPTKQAFPQGGYATTVAWCDPQLDDIMSAGMLGLLRSAPAAES